MKAFFLRRAIERLRDGLFDSIAVSHLTIEDEHVVKSFSKGLKALEKGQSNHLCICGSYGQGKSHNLNFLHHQALSNGYATSFVQLDAREVPLHQFSVVYQSLMEKLSLPDGERFAEAWKRFGAKNSLEILNSMPHRFQMILMAMLSKNKPLKKGSKNGKNLQPKEFSNWLEKALMGGGLSLAHLKQILKFRGIEGYQKQPLVCRGNLPYVQMVKSLGKLLKEMGYKGLVLFFDEAESITQGRLGSRAKSYEILNQFFQSEDSIYSVFAFTEDFFDKVNHEKYEYEDDEKQTFSQNYAEVWKGLNIARLQESSSKQWEVLQNRLIQLYAKAYQIDLSNQIMEIKGRLQNLLDKFKVQETRFKLKALVNQLDIETQNHLLCPLI
jgi:hypothetical protein